jgi:hypothetical protein
MTTGRINQATTCVRQEPKPRAWGQAPEDNPPAGPSPHRSPPRPRARWPWTKGAMRITYHLAVSRPSRSAHSHPQALRSFPGAGLAPRKTPPWAVDLGHGRPSLGAGETARHVSRDGSRTPRTPHSFNLALATGHEPTSGPRKRKALQKASKHGNCFLPIPPRPAFPNGLGSDHGGQRNGKGISPLG